MGFIRHSVIATTISNSLIRDADCIDILMGYMDMDKIDNILILMTQQSLTRLEDTKIKRDLFEVMPPWLRKHVIWPIMQERYNDVAFITRSFLAFNVTLYFDTSATRVRQVDRLMKNEKAFKKAACTSSKATFERLIKDCVKSWRTEANTTAVMDVC
jgi:hypothetical protein